MLIVILANKEQKEELLSKHNNEKVRVEYVSELHELLDFKTADAFFILQENFTLQQIQSITQPLFIHSVISTLDGLKTPSNVSRINAWPTFLQRELWEVATKNEADVKNIFDILGWKFIVVPDEPGLISARIIAMIINEAYFTYEEQISTKEEIDIAMKLGTNYPYGPFEWGLKIGLQNIYNVLKTLHHKSRRYQVALSMEKEIKEFTPANYI